MEFNIIEEWSYANIGPDPMHAKLITYPAVLQRAFVDEGKPDWCRFLNHVGTLVGFLEKLYAPKADKNTFEFLRYYMVLMHRHKLKALLLDTPLRATMHSELKHLVGAHMDLVDHRIDARKKDIFLHNVNYFSDVYPPSLELRFGLSATHQPWTVSLCSMLLDHLLESLHFCHSRLKRKTALVTDAELRVAEALVWFTVSLWQLAQDRDLLGNFWTLWQCQFDGVPYWTVAHLFRSTPSGSAARRGKRKSVSKTLATPRAPEQVLLWIQSLFLPLGPLQRLARAKNNSFLATTLRKRTALGGYVVPICLPHDPRPQSTFTFSCREALEAIAPQGPSGSFDPNLIAKILLRQRDEEWDEGMHSEGALDDLLTVEAVVHPEMYLATLTQSRPPPVSHSSCLRTYTGADMALTDTIPNLDWLEPQRKLLLLRHHSSPLGSSRSTAHCGCLFRTDDRLHAVSLSRNAYGGRSSDVSVCAGSLQKRSVGGLLRLGSSRPGLGLRAFERRHCCHGRHSRIPFC